jgi:F0F1-type ATP synthase assembly protein I
VESYSDAYAQAGIGALNAACWLVGIALGWLLDSHLHTVPLFILLGLVAGAALGVAATSNEVRRYLGE